MRVLLWLTGREQSRTARCVETWQYWRPLPRGVDWSPTAQLRAAIVHSAPHQWMSMQNACSKRLSRLLPHSLSHQHSHLNYLSREDFCPKSEVDSRRGRGASGCHTFPTSHGAAKGRSWFRAADRGGRTPARRRRRGLACVVGLGPTRSTPRYCGKAKVKSMSKHRASEAVPSTQRAR